MAEKVHNIRQVFRPSGLEILFTLLCHPGMEAQPLRTIATAAGVSLAAVGWERKQLEQAGYLLNLGARGRRLTRQPEWLERKRKTVAGTASLLG